MEVKHYEVVVSFDHFEIHDILVDTGLQFIKNGEELDTTQEPDLTDLILFCRLIKQD